MKKLICEIEKNLEKANIFVYRKESENKEDLNKIILDKLYIKKEKECPFIKNSQENNISQKYANTKICSIIKCNIIIYKIFIFVILKVVIKIIFNNFNYC